MRIISLKLVGYKRLSLKNIWTFIIDCPEKFQLILGTNGSGKSSVIRQMCYMVPDSNAFHKSGMREIKLAHQGHVYTLTSTFSPTTKHSFRRDDIPEDLNNGGTATVQKELCRQHFNLTNEASGLLCNDEKFTEMSYTRRREWFTMLSNTNYDFPLKLFKDLSKRWRDTAGALTTAKRRLVTEVSKVLSDEETSKLTHEIEESIQELNVLLEHRMPVEQDAHTYASNYTTTLDELHRLSMRLLRIRFVAPYGVHPTRPSMRDEWREIQKPVFNSIEEIEEVISGIKHEITAKETLINAEAMAHSKLKATIDMLLKNGAQDAHSIRAKILEHRAFKYEELAKRVLDIDFTDSGLKLDYDAEKVQGAFESIYELLSDVFSRIPANEERKYTQSNLVEQQKLLPIKKDERQKFSNTLITLLSKKAHYEEHKKSGESVCPKCKHTWIHGYNEAAYLEVLGLIEQKEKEIKLYDQEIATIETTIEDMVAYSSLYRSFSGCVKNMPILNPFWDYLAEGNYVIDFPRQALSILNQLKTDLEHDVQAHWNTNRMNELGKLLEMAERAGMDSEYEMRQRLGEHEHNVSTLTTDLSGLHKSLQEYQYYRQQMSEAKELGNQIANLMKRADSLNLGMIENLRRETLNHCIIQLQHSLASKQEALSKAKVQKALIDDLEAQIARLTLEEEASKLLVNALSPTEGLIAEGLLGSIRVFTSKMNILISKIWAYPLRILDCGFLDENGAELDYKFKVMVQRKDNVINDVNEGSEGMQEVINLAFKVIAMEYLGLADMPLFLDEFGKSFDETHRSQASATIKALMDQRSFEQLFMVSHYAASHGSFTNAQVCVMCPNNITVPAGFQYNQHVTME